MENIKIQGQTFESVCCMVIEQGAQKQNKIELYNQMSDICRLRNSSLGSA